MKLTEIHTSPQKKDLSFVVIIIQDNSLQYLTASKLIPETIYPKVEIWEAWITAREASFITASITPWAELSFKPCKRKCRWCYCYYYAFTTIIFTRRPKVKLKGFFEHATVCYEFPLTGDGSPAAKCSYIFFLRGIRREDQYHLSCLLMWSRRKQGWF